MKKAARIIYIIGGILNFLSAIPLAIFGFLFVGTGAVIAAGQYTGDIPAGYNAQTLQIAAFVYGFIFLFLALFWLIGGVFSLIAQARVGKGKVIHILALVLGVLSARVLLIVPGILALVAYGKEPKPAPQIQD